MKYSKLIILTLVAVVFTDIIHYIRISGDNVGSTYINAFLNFSSICIFTYISLKKPNKNTPKSILLIFKFWLFLNVFNIIRGAFLAKNYWDWKFLILSSISFSLLCLVFFIGNNLYYVKKIIQFYIKKIFIVGFALIPLTFITNHELYSRIMIPISLFILFIPYLKFKWQLLIIIVAIISISMVIDFRTNIIKIVFSILLLVLIYFQKIIKPFWIKVVHYSLFISPIVLLFLAIFGKFNIYQGFSENKGTVTENGKEVNLTKDTRTFLYVEVLQTLENSGNWLLGESSSQGYKSIWFYNTGGAMNGVRYRTEVNILNILLYHGIIGVIIYFLLLYRVSYIAVITSNNILSKVLGLYIAFRWPMAFIEEFTQYDLNFYFFWLTMGLVSTITFRKMNDVEIQDFLMLK